MNNHTEGHEARHSKALSCATPTLTHPFSPGLFISYIMEDENSTIDCEISKEASSFHVFDQCQTNDSAETVVAWLSWDDAWRCYGLPKKKTQKINGEILCARKITSYV